jgi:p-aminobenzoyl-glutamate transporter AbgT
VPIFEEASNWVTNLERQSNWVLNFEISRHQLVLACSVSMLVARACLVVLVVAAVLFLEGDTAAVAGQIRAWAGGGT